MMTHALLRRSAPAWRAASRADATRLLLASQERALLTLARLPPQVLVMAQKNRWLARQESVHEQWLARAALVQRQFPRCLALSCVSVVFMCLCVSNADIMSIAC